MRKKDFRFLLVEAVVNSVHQIQECAAASSSPGYYFAYLPVVK
jgi:hypothetical protein